LRKQQRWAKEIAVRVAGRNHPHSQQNVHINTVATKRQKEKQKYQVILAVTCASSHTA